MANYYLPEAMNPRNIPTTLKILKILCDHQCRNNIWFFSIGILYLIAVSSYAIGSKNFFFDLFSHFQPQYTLGGISILLLGALFKIDRRMILLASIAVLTHFFLIIYPIRMSDMDQTKASEIDFFFMNSNYFNEKYLDIYDEYDKYSSASQIYEKGSVALVEANEDIIRLFTQEYGDPVEIEGVGGQTCVIFSRTFMAVPNDTLPKFEYPTCIASSRNITQIVVHPYPPLSKELADRQAVYFEQISEYIEELRSTGTDFIVMGDFNSTKYNAVFRRYFGSMDSTDLYTWELGKPWMLQLDHVFSNKPIDVYRSKRLSSDHIGLFINIDQD